MSEGIVDYRIVYRDDGGRLIIVTPAANSGLTVEQVAERDVPAGAEYEIVPADDLLQLVSPTPDEVLAANRAAMLCSRFQAKAALHLAGLLPSVEAAIAQADPVTRIAWAEAVEYRRNSPTILALAAALDLSDEQVDALFRAAMQIEA
ncbi:MAG TPA: hypothetical protein GXX24_09795 [Paracoccus solventivorans]|uniref:Uncharacterized protein n=1 Tax=Paracoccus solventivorans TaxID=53463 RepID=A0A832QWB4_9RHOB|nr:hypothetical protein [Paracoccus solventivorans]HHW34412.1 hypothetical protein [Paracoccus solventivorans]